MLYSVDDGLEFLGVIVGVCGCGCGCGGCGCGCGSCECYDGCDGYRSYGNYGGNGSGWHIMVGESISFIVLYISNMTKIAPETVIVPGPSLSDVYFEIKAGLRVGRKLSEYIGLLSLVNIDHSEISRYIVLDTSGYHRSVVIRDGMLEMAVITWMSGQESDVHGHPGDCIYKMLKGSLREDLYSRKAIRRRNIVEGDCGYICNSIGYHNVKNDSGSYAVSLHVYSPSFPLDD